MGLTLTILLLFWTNNLLASQSDLRIEVEWGRKTKVDLAMQNYIELVERLRP